jgi:Asp-tRNA(Asn)/Glu-tRNA(Gln) amidotransferase B subunit
MAWAMRELQGKANPKEISAKLEEALKALHSGD